MSPPAELSPADLRDRCDSASLPFQTTAELEDLPGVLGQERAEDAIRFAISMRHEGYNLFVLGAMGTGRHEVTRRALEEQAAGEPASEDDVYVQNFASPEHPRALRLPAGRAVGLREDIDHLIEDLRVAIPAAFDTDEYRARRKALQGELEERQGKAFEEVRSAAAAQNVALLQTPTGVALAPMRDGKVLTPEEFGQLPEEERKVFQQSFEALHDVMETLIGNVPRWEREARERLRALEHEVTSAAALHLINELRTRYADLPTLLQHFDAMQADIVEHAARFLPSQSSAEGQIPAALIGPNEQDPHRRYRVNVLVDRTGAHGAPVVYEDEPTLLALVGRVEHVAHLGALLTDHTLIRPGALHKANGGYLMLDARKVLTQPLAWETLKRCLRAGQVRIESLGQALNLISTLSLEPEPIPLRVKVALVGEPEIYHLLSIHDPDFNRLFKIPAEFEDRLDRAPEATLLYCRMLATMARQSALRPLDRGAVARVLSEASRLAGDSGKLSTHVLALGDLLREADHEAAEAGRDHVEEADVDAAIAADERRRGSLRDRIREALAQGTLRVETEGAVVGQVNGLSVLELGGLAIGRPSRITARVWPGRGGVLDIEREAHLGGPIHTKGVLILTGFLGERFGRNRPLALSATLVFEQSYGGVEGDSATLAETAALLSAIAELPLRQDLAVTGSLDQRGEVQAVGGVNEKIEGFFALCEVRGLTGSQGVILPRANQRHLQLRDEVIEAVAAGRFHLWAVQTVDEALALLSGMNAGTRDAAGAWSEASFNHRVDERLAVLAETARRFGLSTGDAKDEPEEKN